MQVFLTTVAIANSFIFDGSYNSSRMQFLSHTSKVFLSNNAPSDDTQWPLTSLTVKTYTLFNIVINNSCYRSGTKWLPGIHYGQRIFFQFFFSDRYIAQNISEEIREIYSASSTE